MITLLHGDCRDVLPTLEAESVQCVITSPPYYALRDYGTAQWEGGDPACEHRGSVIRTGEAGSAKQASNAGAIAGTNGDCTCGARRIDRQIGLEASPDCLAWARGEEPCGACYVCALRGVFRAVWRVLRCDGVAWLNLGDSYTGSGKGGNPDDSPFAGFVGNKARERAAQPNNGRAITHGLGGKQLLGIPWRVALALQADGWILRSDVIWAKNNPMPESVKDRPTRAHEYVFLLAKQPRYYWDAAAVAEPAVNGDPSAPREPRGALTNGAPHVNGGRRDRQGASGPPLTTRNIRSVWTINPQPYPDAHYAVFPEALPERCIRASTRPGDTVLDPFGGSGTTARVAERLQRNAITIELNAAYLVQQEKRTNGVQIEMVMDAPANLPGPDWRQDAPYREETERTPDGRRNEVNE